MDVFVLRPGGHAAKGGGAGADEVTRDEVTWSGRYRCFAQSDFIRSPRRIWEKVLNVRKSKIVIQHACFKITGRDFSKGASMNAMCIFPPERRYL